MKKHCWKGYRFSIKAASQTNMHRDTNTRILVIQMKDLECEEGWKSRVAKYIKYSWKSEEKATKVVVARACLPTLPNLLIQGNEADDESTTRGWRGTRCPGKHLSLPRMPFRNLNAAVETPRRKSLENAVNATHSERNVKRSVLRNVSFQLGCCATRNVTCYRRERYILSSRTQIKCKTRDAFSEAFRPNTAAVHEILYTLLLTWCKRNLLPA